MARSHLLIRRSMVVITTVDRAVMDTGIKGGCIVCLDLACGCEKINATDQLVIPSRINGRVLLDEPGAPGADPAYDFESSTRAAACGSNTTVSHLALQQKGMSLLATMDARRKRTDGRSYVACGFQRVISDPNEQFLGRGLPAAVACDGHDTAPLRETGGHGLAADRDSMWYRRHPGPRAGPCARPQPLPAARRPTVRLCRPPSRVPRP